MTVPRDPNAGGARPGDVAIVGMSCLFPEAANVDAYWRNILGKVDAVSDPPAEAWDPDVYYDPDAPDTDRVYCKRGGYLGAMASFDPLPHGIPPMAVGGEPDQWLALQLARDAMVDAGYAQLDERVRQRTAVILGKGTYLNGGNATVVQHALMIGQTLALLKSLHPEYTDEELGVLRRELKKTLPPMGPETVPGLIPNIIVGRIANRLDLMGPSYTIDAACASSLIAVQRAMRDLQAGECDLALVGGSQVWIPVATLNVFCQLGALSRRQEIRPFDEAADGTLLGEGIGMVVLKRLADAERDGDRIYAVVKGVGVASDGRGVTVMAPRVEGEELALRRAYEAAGVAPATVGLIEAHGTGTPVGDVVEIQALTRVFGGRDGALPRCAIGSVKSMISHTMPAAGVAGLIKAALALHHKVLPPTLHCDHPNPKLELEKTPFYVSTEARPWVHGGTEPRRAGVNAFGFGGINAHVVLEEHVAPTDAASKPLKHLPPRESEAIVFEGADRGELLERMGRLARFLDSATAERGDGRPEAFTLADLAFTLSSAVRADGETCRLGLVATSLEDLRAKLERAAKRLADPRCRQIKDVSGIYFAAEPLGRAGNGKVAFLFPGEGAQYPTMLADLCLHVPEVRACFDRTDRMLHGHPRGYLPSDYIFPRPTFSEDERAWAARQLMRMDGAVEAVLTANQAVLTVLQRLGIRPDAVAGHSTGEYSAMAAAGILDLDADERLRAFIVALNDSYDDGPKEDVPRAVLLAVGAERERVEAIAREAGGDVFVAMHNCPHQAVLVGEREAADRALEIVRREGLIYEYLTFDRAYHTHLFAPYAGRLRQIFDRLTLRPPSTVAYSCTTAAPYPADPAEVRELMIEHWSRPVEFQRTVERLYDDGVRIFVEAGPRGNLTAFVEDILRGRPFCAVPANVQRRSGITQLHHLVAMLSAHGLTPDFGFLYEHRDCRAVAWEAPERQPAARRDTRVELSTTFPMMRIADEVARQLRREPGAATERTEPGLVGNAEPGQSKAAGAPAARGEASQGERRAAEAVEEPAPPPPASMEGEDDEVVLVRRQLVGDGPPTAREPAAAAMQGYWQTMEEFLETQEQVMQSYLLSCGPADPGSVGPASDCRAASDCGRMVDTGTAVPESMEKDVPRLAADMTLGPTAVAVPAIGPQSEAVPSPRSEAAPLSTAVPDPAIRPPYPIAPQATTEEDNADRSPNRLGAGRSPTPQPRPEADSQPYPLLGSVASLTPGVELVARRVFDPAEDLYLRDHTLGRTGSLVDPDLLALAVMPLTMSMEILAEAAAALVPGSRVVGMREVRAYRWVAWDDRPQTLQVTARRPPGQDGVDVQLRNLTEDELAGAPAKSPVIEATVLLAESYPAAPAPRANPVPDGRPSRWAPERLYADAMFHGPSWQGVARIDRTGEGGTSATLRALPRGGFLRSDASPSFVLDPVVLDAAGQVIGFWTMEHLASGRVIFPFRLERLSVYGPPRPAGEDLRCAASIRLVGDQEVRSDVDVLDAAGRLWMRLDGWWDKRFDLPASFHALVASSPGAAVSEPWPAPIAAWAAPLADSEMAASATAVPLQCRRVLARFPSDASFWKRVWAQRILSRAEREQFAALRTPEPRQLEWLGGRAAAKEAVRDLVQAHAGLDLPLVDVEIRADERGRPVVGGAWRALVGAAPVVSIAHTDGWAVALAGLGGSSDGAEASPRIGVDVERVRALPDGFAETAYSDAERRVFESLPAAVREEWLLRAWCAKEAVAKALGDGLVEGPHSAVIAGVDVEGEAVCVRLAGVLAAAHPEEATTPLLVHTGRDADVVVAVTRCDRATVALDQREQTQ